MQKTKLTKEWNIFFNMLTKYSYFHIDNQWITKLSSEKIIMIKKIKEEFDELFDNYNYKKNKNSELINKFRLNLLKCNDKTRYQIFLKNESMSYFLKNEKDIYKFLEFSKENDLKFYVINFYPKIKKIDLSNYEIGNSYQFIIKLLYKNKTIKNRKEKIQLIMNEFIEKEHFLSFCGNLFSADELFALMLENEKNLKTLIIKSINYNKDINNIKWFNIKKIINKSKIKELIALKKDKELIKTIDEVEKKWMHKNGKKIKTKFPNTINKKILEEEFSKIKSPFSLILEIPEEIKPSALSSLFATNTNSLSFDTTKVPAEYQSLFFMTVKISCFYIQNYMQWRKKNKKEWFINSGMENFIVEIYQTMFDNPHLAGQMVCLILKNFIEKKIPKNKEKFKKPSFYENLKEVSKNMPKNLQYAIDIVFAPVDNWFNFKNQVTHFDEKFQWCKIMGALSIWRELIIIFNNKKTI